MAGVDRGLERELKFEVEADFVLPDFGPRAAAERREVVLTADYWDTDDLRLLRWGHSLRHRRASDGSEDGWTLKLAVPRGSAKGASRDELDLAGPPDAVPSELQALVAAFVRRERLGLRATLVTVRRSALLTGEGAAARYELADDLVTSRIGDAAGPTFRQIEVEALGLPSTGGDVPATGEAPDPDVVETGLDELAAALEAAGAGPAGSAPKLALVLQDRLGPPEVAAPALDHRATVAELVSGALASGLRRLVLHDPYVRLGDDPEAVHQARVATRRLRSDLRTLSPLLDAAAVARWRSELSWLGGLLGGVRDLDVLEPRLAHEIDDLWSPPEASGRAADSGREALLQVVRSERDVRRAVLVDVLGSARYLGLLDELVAAAAAPPLAAGVDADDRAAPTAAKLTRRAWRRLRRAVPGRHDDPADAELHEVRKRAKQARYAAELAGRRPAGELAHWRHGWVSCRTCWASSRTRLRPRAWLADVAPDRATARRVDGNCRACALAAGEGTGWPRELASRASGEAEAARAVPRGQGRPGGDARSGLVAESRRVASWPRSGGAPSPGRRRCPRSRPGGGRRAPRRSSEVPRPTAVASSGSEPPPARLRGSPSSTRSSASRSNCSALRRCSPSSASSSGAVGAFSPARAPLGVALQHLLVDDEGAHRGGVVRRGRARRGSSGSGAAPGR